MDALKHRSFSSISRSTIAVVVAFVFLCLLPFSGALEIHHLFAEVDHDGHEHSDFDLCKWVQQHSSESLVLEVPSIEEFRLDPVRRNRPPISRVVSLFDYSVSAPRAPPFS